MNTQFRKGIIELCVLSLINEKDMYGYELIKEISQYIDVSENTIYPILRRLTKEDKLSIHIKIGDGGKARKYYKLNYEGQLYLKENIEAWDSFMLSVNKILKRNINYFREVGANG